MKRHVVFIALCLLTLSSCSIFNKTQGKQPSTKEETEEIAFDTTDVAPPPPPPLPSTTTASSDVAERYKSLIAKKRIDHSLLIKKVVELNGKLYLIIEGNTQSNQLWEFDGDTTFNKLIGYSDFEDMEAQGKSGLKFEVGYEYANKLRGVSSLAVSNNKLYFSFSYGRASDRLFQYSFTQGPLVIDGVTNVNCLTACDSFGIVYGAIADNDVEGLFTIDESENAKLLIEWNTFYPNYIQDGIPYSGTLPIINNNLYITSNGCPFVLMPNEETIRWKCPERFRVETWAQIEDGLFFVDNLVGTFFRFENDCEAIKDASSLPEYMRVYKIDDIKSIDNTVYFNAKTPPPSESKVLYYKNENAFGDLTETFKQNDIKVKDLITSFRGNLIIGKRLDIKNYYYSIAILQSYNRATNELKDITYLGEPMEINHNSVAFQYNEHLYFVGSNTEHKNCLWRYDGINDPEPLIHYDLGERMVD